MVDKVFISPTRAWILSALFAVSYVAFLYVLPSGRLVFTKRQVEVGPNADRARASNERWRNDPSVIRARLTGVLMATLFSVFMVHLVVAKTGELKLGDMEALKQTRHLLGLSLSHVPTTAWLLAPIMYTGPLYHQTLDKGLPFQRHWWATTQLRTMFTDWVSFRNYVAAPITEELVYRSCIVGIMQLGNASTTSMIFLSPLWFGAAHLHHGWDLYNRFGRTKVAIKRAVMTIVFQQVYTSIFGWFEVFLFLRTGSILPCIFAHSFCNFYGVPLPFEAFSDHPRHKIDLAFAYLFGFIAFGLVLGPWTRASFT